MSKRGEHHDNGMLSRCRFHSSDRNGAVHVSHRSLHLCPTDVPSGEFSPQNATLSFPRENWGDELCGRKSLPLLYEKTTCV